MSPSPSDSSKANIIAFVNPFPNFAATPRLEILVDWRDAPTWNNALGTSIDFEIYAVKADQAAQYLADDTTHLGKPVLTSSDLTPSLPEKDITVIRRRIEGYLHLSGILSQYTFPPSDRLASIARAADLSAFAPQKAGAAGKWVSEPIRVPHPPEFHQDVTANSQLLLAHVAHLRVWNENLITRYIEAEKDPKLRILTTGTGQDAPPVLEALRNAARNEPTFGRILNVLYCFEISSDGFKRLQSAKSDFLWLYARPSNLSTSGSDVVLVPTRLVVDAMGAASYLEQDAETRKGVSFKDVIAAYQPNKVSAHQLISSEVFETLPPTSHRHLIYTKRTKAAIHAHVTQLKNWTLNKATGSIAEFLRFKRPGDADTFKAKCLDSVETDVQSIYNVDRPYDSIGIVWDHDQAVPTQNVNAAHVGYKGFRIDRVTDKGSDSTCIVEKHILFPSGQDIYLTESDLLGSVEGFVPVDCQNDPTIGPYKADTSAKDIEMVVPRQFHVFDGYNSATVNPLDQLISSAPEDIVVSAADPLVVLKNISRTGRLLKYGDEIGFGVRKVAMTGLSPLCDVKTSLKTWSTSQPDSIFLFQRYVPIQEPAIKLSLRELKPQSQAGNGSDQSTNLYQVTGSSPRLQLGVQYPLAHYKLALHAAVEIGDLGDDFNTACKSFVYRNDQKLDSSGFLRAFDPHASSVEVVSQIWYPFSANPAKDRQLTTGRSKRSTNTAGLSFSDLVVKAQQMLADQKYPENFDVPVLMPGHYEPTVDLRDVPDPQIFVGLRNRIQCRGGYDNPPNPQLSKEVFLTPPLENPKITRAWTLNPVVHPSDKPFAIGGDVDPKVAAKQMAGSASSYGSLLAARLERYLSVPPTQQDTTSPGDSVTEPARGTPFQWRKRLMPAPYMPGADKQKYYSSNVAAFSKYFTFLSANILKADYGNSGLSVSPTISPKDPSNGDYTIIANWSGAHRQMVIPGFHFPRPVTVEEVLPDSIHDIGYVASLGDLLASTRKLPFIDDDVVWIVRLQWRVDLTKSGIPRGYELSAVKEFRVYLTEGTDLDLNNLPPSIATLPVPSRQALNNYDLDQVWWVMFDAVADRKKHDRKYHVVAFPQDGAIFTTNEWFEIPVLLPCSEFDSQPEKLVPLPLKADPDRGFAFIFNVPAGLDKEARKKLKVALRVAHAVGDPLLATDNSAKALESDRTELNEGNALNQALLKACSDPNGLPAALDYLFPSLPSVFIQENEFPKNPFADGPGTVPQSVDGWVWANGTLHVPDNGNKLVFSHVLSAMDTQNPPTKNPFLKFNIAYFSPESYPRLRHTTGSDFILSEWVQAFPDDLVVEETNKPVGLIIKNAWGGNSSAGAAKQEACVLYRFHTFISQKQDGNIPAFHVSSFYSSSPVLSYVNLATKLRDSLLKFGLNDLSTTQGLQLTIGVEEGLWALASATSPGMEQVGAGSEAVFVVLRSGKAAFGLPFAKLVK
jgi:hypothetical protein